MKMVKSRKEKLRITENINEYIRIIKNK